MAATASALLIAVLPAALAATTTTPQIVARPENVMVNTIVQLRGTGFPTATTLQLKECSLKTWIVPQNVCLTDNAVDVTTNALGSFTTSMKAEICPAVRPVRRTERTCYIGEPKPNGVDTIELLGAARIVVSWP